MKLAAAVRWAGPGELDWCTAHDDLPGAVVSRKVDLGEYLVAEADGQIIGFLRLEYLWSKVPYIGMIRVLPSLRGRGAGAASAASSPV